MPAKKERKTNAHNRDAPRRSFLEVMTAVSSIVTPFILLALTGLGWVAQQEIQRQNAEIRRIQEINDELRDDRIDIYNKTLEPFILLFMKDEAWEADPANEGRDREKLATQILLSVDYRRNAFELTLIGSDAVIRRYNDLLQYFYHRDPTKPYKESDSLEMLGLLGSFLLEIRKSVGNETTELDRLEMLEWLVIELRALREVEQGFKKGQ